MNMQSAILMSDANLLLLPFIQARDIVKYLVDKDVQDAGNFDWASQLRYYWKFDEVGK